MLLLSFWVRQIIAVVAVGDITPGIPKYPFVMTNIYIIYQVIYADIKKHLNSKVGPNYSFSGRHIEDLAGL
jgi:hypothetical protein